MEAGGRRRKGQRILYFFRTPPAVRVGREAIDEEAMRLLEQHNPDVTFDWARLLKGAGAPAPLNSPDDRRPRRERREPHRQREQGRPAPHGATPARPSPAEAEPFEPDEPFDPVEQSRDVQAGEPQPDEPVEPADSRDPVLPEPAVELPERYARLGADGVSRLRARYADIAVRLAARPMEEAERAELLARAEQLNPDAWTTPDEVTAALEAYEAVFDSIRSVVGRRRS
jgi:hypothetical protein